MYPNVYEFKQISLLNWILPNTKDEQVPGAVHVAFSIDTYQGKLISADIFHIHACNYVQHELRYVTCMSVCHRKLVSADYKWICGIVRTWQGKTVGWSHKYSFSYWIWACCSVLEYVYVHMGMFLCLCVCFLK